MSGAAYDIDDDDDDDDDFSVIWKVYQCRQYLPR